MQNRNEGFAYKINGYLFKSSSKSKMLKHKNDVP